MSGIIEKLIRSIKEVAEELIDNRKQSNARRYGIAEGILSAFALFYFQHPSLLNFQQEMDDAD